MERREKEKRSRCCITLNLPEYLLSEPYDRVYPLHQCTWHPSEFSLLSLFFSPTLLFTPVSPSLSAILSSPFSPLYPASFVRSLARSLARPFSLCFLFSFLLRLLFGVNPPISYALHRIPGVGVIFQDIDSPSGRRRLPLQYRDAKLLAVPASLWFSVRLVTKRGQEEPSERSVI